MLKHLIYVCVQCICVCKSIFFGCKDSLSSLSVILFKSMSVLEKEKQMKMHAHICVDSILGDQLLTHAVSL